MGREEVYAVVAQRRQLTDPVLEFRSVGVTYGEKVVSKGISFTVNRGEVVCVLGPSGCGKSSLIKIAAGLQRPSHGQVFSAGDHVKGPSRERAVVFQEDALLPWRTVLANVGLPLELRKERQGVRTVAANALRDVGLEVSGDVLPGQLSGGMRQRAQLARALVSEPGALLLDEPFSALDYVSRRSMQDLIRQVMALRELAVLIVSHDIGEAVRMADRTVILGGEPSGIAAVYDRRVGDLAVNEDRAMDPLVTAFGDSLVSHASPERGAAKLTSKYARGSL